MYILKKLFSHNPISITLKSNGFGREVGVGQGVGYGVVHNSPLHT